VLDLTTNVTTITLLGRIACMRCTNAGPAYCYRSSVVCVSVCLLVTTVSLIKAKCRLGSGLRCVQGAMREVGTLIPPREGALLGDISFQFVLPTGVINHNRHTWALKIVHAWLKAVVIVDLASVIRKVAGHASVLQSSRSLVDLSPSRKMRKWFVSAAMRPYITITTATCTHCC